MPAGGVLLERSCSWELRLYSFLLGHVRDIHLGIHRLSLSAVHTDLKAFSNFKFASSRNLKQVP